MPLEHSASPQALKRNMHTLMADIGKSPHVQSRAQAIAIGLETQRRAARDHADGGVAGYDIGGGVADPVQAVIGALQQGEAYSGSGTSPAAPGATNTAAPSSAQATAATNQPVTAGVAPTTTASTTQATTSPAVVAPSSAPAVPTPTVPSPAVGVAPSTPSAPSSAAASPTTPANPMLTSLLSNPQSLVQALASGLATGGVANRQGGGGFKINPISPDWIEKQNIRSMKTGPIVSAAPGRLDNHRISVPAGSYVLSSRHVNAMGDGNTNAGLAMASHMFGSGPYGSPMPKLGGGHGMMPHAPKPFTNFADGGTSEGGARGDGHFEPTPVNVSAGEFIIHPAEIIRRFGSLKNGHRILDAWMGATHKKELKIQKTLPAPAKK